MLGQSASGPWFRWRGNQLTVRVRITPRAKQTQIQGVVDHQLKIRLNAPPVAGKANTALVAFLGKQFGVSRSQVALVKGEKSRIKQLEISNPQCFPAMLEAELSR